MTERILILDDDPERMFSFKRIVNKYQNLDAVYCSTADEAIEACLGDEPFDYILLDHDLGGTTYQSPDEHNTGNTVASFIRDNPQLHENARIFIHSLNHPGARLMQNKIPQATLVPFIWFEDVFKRYIR